MRRSVWLIVGIALSGCRCGTEKLVYAGPHTRLTETLEFGTVRVATRVTKKIEVLNDGRQELTVVPSVDDATDASFAVDFTPGVTLTEIGRAHV